MAEIHVKHANNRQWIDGQMAELDGVKSFGINRLGWCQLFDAHLSRN